MAGSSMVLKQLAFQIDIGTTISTKPNPTRHFSFSAHQVQHSISTKLMFTPWLVCSKCGSGRCFSAFVVVHLTDCFMLPFLHHF